MKAKTEVSAKAENQAYLAAIERLFAPIARLMIAHRIEPIPELNELLESILISFGAFVCDCVSQDPQAPSKTKIRDLLAEKSGQRNAFTRHLARQSLDQWRMPNVKES